MTNCPVPSRWALDAIFAELDPNWIGPWYGPGGYCGGIVWSWHGIAGQCALEFDHEGSCET